MLDYTLLNLGSLLCGLAGWIVPCLGLWKGRLSKPGRQGMASAISLSLCGLALWMQLWYQQYLADIEDWSAIMDTAGAVTRISAVLLITKVLLNLVLLAAAPGKGRKPGAGEEH